MQFTNLVLIKAAKDSFAKQQDGQTWNDVWFTKCRHLLMVVMCSTCTHKCLEMQFKCIQHVDMSGLQMGSESALTSSGKHSITDDYDSLKKG